MPCLFCFRPLYPTWFRWNKNFYINLMRRYKLYIPHGSDETVTKHEKKVIEKYFISHMVQMKLIFLWEAWQLRQSLYPTWFRWNDCSECIAFSILLTLYPTWFRWNLFQGHLKQLIFCNFISHMVQMKLIFGILSIAFAISFFISHMVQMKQLFDIYVAQENADFISHMVQMKRLHGHSSIYQRAKAPLYPTWFRWNYIMKFKCDAIYYPLYIPHGSDETQNK